MVKYSKFPTIKAFFRHDPTVASSSDPDGATNRNGAVDNLEGRKQLLILKETVHSVTFQE